MHSNARYQARKLALLAQEPLGQGAFATVQKCRLRRPSAAAGGSPGNSAHGARATPSLRWAPSRRAVDAPGQADGMPRPLPLRKEALRQLVAVKQLKPAVLSNETELRGFIAETDGG